MTIAWRRGEEWAHSDGAPEGPHFDVTIGSSSRPDRSYRIVRDAVAILHIPQCEAWQHGHKSCSHTQRAIALTERPESTFLKDAMERWRKIGGELATGDDLYAFWAETYRDALTAREVRFKHMRIASARAEWMALPPEEQTALAVATFDRPDPREAA